ncbi:D-alanyl-D-alanine carboxypeptidase family protein [Marinibaculum pumilum]|uniref:serine-type D-Ala-D-Ala carboxypeptidase n=1 Tax=Marinibaculum pumilum TaxID=1766165 RepID=A0ABV7KUJ7_9PROT
MTAIAFPNRRPAGRLAAAAMLLLFCLLLPLQGQAASSLDTVAEEAIMIDDSTGTVLLEKNADRPMPPSSMAKLMTAYIVFDRLKKGELSLEDTFSVSEKAWRTGGSKMFVLVNDQVTVSDLLRGIIVQSGNDATVVVAENLSGSEERFAELMTETGRRIGLTDSVFKNASGLPAEGQHMTARDLATLAKRIVEDFPEHYEIYSEKNFTYADISQGNRNPLLYKSVGADGLKTGHTEDAGYGLTASAIQDGRRIYLVLNGLESQNARAREAERLIRAAFNDFKSVQVFKAGETVAEAKTWLGSPSAVPLVLEEDLAVTLPRRAGEQLSMKYVYDEPVPAPISKGTPIARLVIEAPGIEPIERPLLAGADVTELGLVGRIGAALNYLVWGNGGEPG